MALRNTLRFAIAGMLAASAAAQPASAQDTNETYVAGYIRFMAYHEAGHLLMNQIGGINGSNASQADIERQADDFAAVLLMPDPGDDEAMGEILGAAAAWLRTGPRLSATDPHAPPEERAEQIICHIYGSDPEAFSDFKEIIRPEWNCEDAYKAMASEIEGNYYNKTGQEGVQIEVSYQPPAAGLERAAAFLKDTEILEDLAKDVAEDFRLTRPTKLMAMNCTPLGQAMTFHYDSFPAQNLDRIAICYELVDTWLKQDFSEDR